MARTIKKRNKFQVAEEREWHVQKSERRNRRKAVKKFIREVDYNNLSEEELAKLEELDEVEEE